MLYGFPGQLAMSLLTDTRPGRAGGDREVRSTHTELLAPPARPSVSPVACDFYRFVDENMDGDIGRLESPWPVR
jgi:hypothetical protein